MVFGRLVGGRDEERERFGVKRGCALGIIVRRAKCMYSEKERIANRERAMRKKDMIQRRKRKKMCAFEVVSRGDMRKKEKKKRSVCTRKEKKTSKNHLTTTEIHQIYMAWLSMLRTTAASSTFRRRRNLRAQSRLLFRVRSFRSLSSLTRPSGNESHLHLRGCMVGDMLWTFLRWRRRLQFWFLLGLNARLQTGQSKSWEAEEEAGVDVGAEPTKGAEAVVGLDEDSGVSGRRWRWWMWPR